MPNGQYSQDELANTLARIQKRRRDLAGNNPNSPVASRDYREAVTFDQFTPQVMDTKVNENPFAPQISQQIGRVSSQATARSGVEAQNRFNFQELQRQQALLEEAKKNRVKPTKQTIQPPGPLQTPTVGANGVVGHNHVTGAEYAQQQGNGLGGGPAIGTGSSYYTQTPEWLDPNAGLTTFKAGGHSWTLNASVAPRFQAFINALVATGYKIKTASSYADRNQANGSGNPSLHSMGLAIDINAYAAGNSYNPGNTGVHQTNLPKGISALAAKYGLVWGGDWRNSKDYMHFSVPYKGLM